MRMRTASACARAEGDGRNGDESAGDRNGARNQPARSESARESSFGSAERSPGEADRGGCSRAIGVSPMMRATGSSRSSAGGVPGGWAGIRYRPAGRAGGGIVVRIRPIQAGSSRSSRLIVDAARPNSRPIAVGPRPGWPCRRSGPARPRTGKRGEIRRTASGSRGGTTSTGKCPAGWWALRVDPWCLLAAVDRGDGASIAVGLEECHGAFGEGAAVA